MGTEVKKPEFQPGDIVRYYSNGFRHGRIVSIGYKWVHVDCIGRDPRTRRVRRFLHDQIQVDPQRGESS